MTELNYCLSACLHVWTWQWSNEELAMAIWRSSSCSQVYLVFFLLFLFCYIFLQLV